MGFSIKSIILVFLIVELTSSLSSRDLELQNLPNSTDHLYNSSNHTSLNLTALIWDDLQAYKRCQNAVSPQMDPLSCDDALKKIPLFGDPETGVDVRFRHRHEKPPAGVLGTVPLPIRWLSDDGNCAVDLTLYGGKRNYDVTNGDEIASVAESVFETCVEGQRRGGYIRKFSQRNQLKVEYTSYEQQRQNVVCDPAPPVPMSEQYRESCEDALLRLPTGIVNIYFAETRIPGRTTITRLPRREPEGKHPVCPCILEHSKLGEVGAFTSIESGIDLPNLVMNKCATDEHPADDFIYRKLSLLAVPRVCFTSALKNSHADKAKETGPLLVDMLSTAGVAKASWWNIWTAGVAVYTMCIQNGRKGTASNIGDPGAIYIRLGA